MYLNICIRLPGVLFGAFITYLNFLYNPFKNYNLRDHIILSIIMVLNLTNAIYFGIDVCVNYGYKTRLLEEAIEKTI